MIYQADIGNQRIAQDFDQTLVWSAILLLSLGLVMVYSASIAIAEAGRGTGGYAAHFLVRHGAYLLVGILVGLIAFQMPMPVWQKYSFHLFLLGVLLLVLVLIPGIGREVNGSRRWLSLLVVNLQPSEFVKLFVVIPDASCDVSGRFTAAKRARLRSIRRYHRHCDGNTLSGRG
jgi:cell division protein FtsW